MIFCSAQLTDAQNISSRLFLADSLFENHKYAEAIPIYEQALAQNRTPSPSIYLKLAFVYEKEKNWIQTQYYLNLYYEQVPDERILKKMNEIARDQSWKGYELDDFNFLILLFKQYSAYLIALLMGIALYVFGVLFTKRLKRQYTPFRYKVVFLLYWVLIVLLVNLPERYRQVIIRKSGAILREDPSAAAPMAETIPGGHRLKVVGSTDIWYQVLWENRLRYVKAADVWVVR